MAVFEFGNKINATYTGLIGATSILALLQKLRSQEPSAILGLKSVIWDL